MGSQSYTTPGIYTFTVPSGVTSVNVKCYGAGGRGGSADRGGGRGGGGAGGNYAESTLPVSPSQQFQIDVGNGCTSSTFSVSGSSGFINPNDPKLVASVLATGGIQGQNVSPSTPAFGTGATATTTGCKGNIIRIGGNGGNGVDAGSGAGGGCAGPTAVGGNATNITAGTGNSPGGNGAAGQTSNAAGLTGNAYGGGGSGGRCADIHLGATRLGGCGGHGAVIITWADSPPSGGTCVCIYSNCSSLSSGCYLYTDLSLTSPVPAGYYSDGTTCFTVSGTSGLITGTSSCSPATTYYVYADRYYCDGLFCTFSGVNEIIASYSNMSFGEWYQGTSTAEAYQVTSTTTDPGYSVPFMYYGPFSSCPLPCGSEV